MTFPLTEAVGSASTIGVMSLNHIRVRPGIARRVGIALAVSAAMTAFAGEKMVESAPSKERPRLPARTTPIDPILDRVLNPGGASSSFNPGGMPVVPGVPQTRPGIDPNLQRQWGLQADRKRNWLLENAAQFDSQGQLRELATDPTPQFSRPTAILQVPGTGERYLRATEADRPEQTEKANDPSKPIGSESEADRQNNVATSAESSRAIPFRSMTGDGTSVRGAEASLSEQKGAFSDPGGFANSGRSVLEDARKIAAEERSAVFDRLLSSQSQAPGVAQEPSPLGGLGLSKTPPSRSQQFQSLLATPPEAASAGLFGSQLSASAAPRAAAGNLGERPTTSLAPAAAPVAPKAAPVRLEPRPALLQIPTRGF